MATIADPVTPKSMSPNDDRIRRLAHRVYTLRQNCASDADYDWNQAQREVEFVALFKEVATVVSDIRHGRIDVDRAGVSARFRQIRENAAELFEPLGESLAEELDAALQHIDQSLCADATKRPSTKKPLLRRFLRPKASSSANIES